MKKEITLEEQKEEYRTLINELAADCKDIVFLRQVYTIMIRRARKEGWR